MTIEMPTEKSDWEELPIKKVFGVADTYGEGMEKLILAEDTSNIDDAAMSATEFRAREKKRRRLKAQKRLSSSSEEDNLSVVEDKENNMIKMVPSFPKKEHFISNQLLIGNPHKQNTQNILCENTCFTAVNSNNPTSNKTQNVAQSSVSTEHFDSDEYNKKVLWKLNKILYELSAIRHRLDVLEQKTEQSSSNQTCNRTEIANLLPLRTNSELISFDQQLEDRKFQDDVSNFFKLLGGSTAYILIRNIFKTTMTDQVAKHYSWAGRKSKQSFKDLKLSKVIIQAVHASHEGITDCDIAEYASKWLAQATVRIGRDKHEELIDKLS